jgi:CDP-diacylglycerol---glycerol-3-phosphate 3-phosphatidyltransferase
MHVNDRDPAKLFPHDHLFKYTIIPLIPRGITPNMITILRFLLTPAVLWFLWMGDYTIGLPFFIFISLTDALDGSLARVRKQITDWGTFYDPIADKLLISSVVLLIVVQHIGLVFGLVIIILEALIILGGYYRRRRGSLHGANIFGKTKMVLQVVGVSFLLLAIWLGFNLFFPISVGVLSLAIIFAIISLFTYGL